MNTLALTNHLTYKIPQLKLALIKEPSAEPLPQIQTPADFEDYLMPMKHLPDYVPSLNMCHSCRQDTLWLEERVFCDT